MTIIEYCLASNNDQITAVYVILKIAPAEGISLPGAMISLPTPQGTVHGCDEAIAVGHFRGVGYWFLATLDDQQQMHLYYLETLLKSLNELHFCSSEDLL